MKNVFPGAWVFAVLSVGCVTQMCSENATAEAKDPGNLW